MAAKSTTDDDKLSSAEAEAEAIAKETQAACATEESAESEAPVDLGAELAAERDRALRLQAEMENLRSRTAREVLNERRYGALPLLRDMLPVIDNIDRALEAAQQSGESADMLEGFKLVRQQMVGILLQHQCQEIDALGQPFDPQIHEAILQQPSEEQPAGNVMQVTETGFQLHDRVVRPAKVIVSSGPSEVSAEE